MIADGVRADIAAMNLVGVVFLKVLGSQLLERDRAKGWDNVVINDLFIGVDCCGLKV